MNIYEDYFSRRDLEVRTDIETAKTYYVKYYYSPAHIEELAFILRSEDDEEKALKYIYDRLINISNLTKNFEFLPSHSSIVTTTEHPTVCFKRVIDNYDATLLAEANEKFVFSIKDQKTLREYYGDDEILNIDTFDDLQKNFDIDKRELNDISPEKLFSTQKVINAFNSIMSNYCLSMDTLPKWEHLKDSHKEIEGIMALLYNFLEKIGFKSEPLKKLCSRMHDVSHGIYATGADILVTGDDKFYKKTKAIYSLLEVPTLVLSKSEFNAFVAEREKWI